MSQQGPKQRRKALKDAQRDMEAELNRERGDYVPPDRDACQQKEWYTSVDDSATLRISVWVWRYDGRLVDFVMRVEAGDWSNPEDWQEIARIDCAGGRCHIHPPDDPEKHELIHRLDSIDDVELAFGQANDLANSVATMIRDRRS